MLNTQYYSPSTVPLEENQQEQTNLIPFFPSQESLRYPINHHQDHNPPLKVEEHMPHGAPNDLLILRLMPGGNDHDNNYKNKEINDRSLAGNSGNSTAKWMSSKMRIMRKMMNSDSQQVQQSSTGESSSGSIGNRSSSNVNGIIRVCSDCGTTKTPLWRTGPQGPKSLCNACGIRQRKARKAMAALNEKQNSATDAPAKPKLTKEKGSNSGSGIVPYKKRFRYKLNKPTRKIGFEDFGIGLNQSSGFHPQDEKEAAILLMAMSCDLIFG